MTPVRRGFTLLEILIAVAIIAILVAAAYVGISSLSRGAKDNQTKVVLGGARAMLSDFLDATRSSASGTARRPQPDGWDYNDATGAADPVTSAELTATPTLSFWTLPAFQDLNGDNLRQENEPIIPLMAPVGVVEPNNAVLYDAYQVRNARIALRLMANLPTVKKALSEITSGSREKPADIPAAVPAALKTEPLLVDGWGRPLLFVPGGGLMGVIREGYPTGNTIANPIKSPDERPFWASAGDDGDFSKGDDNIYSFEN